MNRNGYTLMELLVTAAIMMVVAALLFPVLSAAKKRAQEAPCVSNMRQLFMAIGIYSEEYGGTSSPPAHLLLIFPYVADKSILSCPSDTFVKRQPKGWPVILGVLWNDPSQQFSDSKISYAYLRDYPPANREDIWTFLSQREFVGVLACQWHAKPTRTMPAPYDEIFSPPMAGAILRIRFDGSLFRWTKTNDQQWSTSDMFYYPYLLPKMR